MADQVNAYKDECCSYTFEEGQLVFTNRQSDQRSEQGLQIDINTDDGGIDTFQGKTIQQVGKESGKKQYISKPCPDSRSKSLPIDSHGFFDTKGKDKKETKDKQYVQDCKMMVPFHQGLDQNQVDAVGRSIYEYLNISHELIGAKTDLLSISNQSNCSECTDKNSDDFLGSNFFFEIDRRYQEDQDGSSRHDQRGMNGAGEFEPIKEKELVDTNTKKATQGKQEPVLSQYFFFYHGMIKYSEEDGSGECPIKDKTIGLDGTTGHYFFGDGIIGTIDECYGE